MPAGYAEDVTPGRDEDALSWAGDDDPTLEVAPAQAPDDAPTAAGETAALPEGWSAVGRGSEAVPASPAGDEVAAARGPVESDDADAAREPMGSVELISLGVLGGFSVLYAAGWLIGALRLQGTAQFLVAPVAYQVSLWLAVLAPLVWFGCVYALTTHSRRWVRFAWLIGGVVLLIPWPFIMVGAIGR